MTIEVNKEEAKKFLLFKQFLYPPQQLEGNAGIEKVFNTLRAIQYDPQNPCGRSIDLSLQARVKNIHPSDYYHWLYTNRKGIEIYDKELCIVPIEDVPLCRKRFPPSRKRKYDKFIKEHEKELDSLINFIKKNGTVSSNDIRDGRKVNIFWETATWSKAALDALWKTGKLIIAYRKNGRKYYDIPERVYGDKFIWEYDPEDDNIWKLQIIRRIKCVGLLPISGTGQGWQGLGTGKEIAPIISKLSDEKKLVKVKIGGIKREFVINASDYDIITKISEMDADKRLCFLSPLDNILWDRNLVFEIFGFNYKWETYTPVKHRMYGHYVLPILYNSNFIGRIEPKFLSTDNVLEIRGIWLEDHIYWNKNISEAFYKYLGTFKSYLKADEIKWVCNPPKH